VEGTPSRESSPSSTEFGFDEEVLNTKVYRRRMRRVLGDSKDHGQSRGSPGSCQEEHRSKKRCRDENFIDGFDNSSSEISKLENDMKRSKISR
jgi:hypothetical protein